LGDSDGDGFTDAEEYLAYFDPDDRDDFPYEGHYPRGPLPKEIEGEGWGPGDVSNSWDNVDQFGETLDLHKFYGNVVMIDIGSEWCGPCQAAAPEAEEHYQDFKEEGFVVLGFLMDGLANPSTPEPERWIEEFDLTYPVFADQDQNQVQHYVPVDADESFGIPLFAFIGRDLTIEIHGVTGNDWEVSDIEDLLAAEVPYVEWPMPENTGDLRAEFGITVASHHDTHLDDNIALALESIGSGATVSTSGGGDDSDEDGSGDDESEDSSSDGGGSAYAPSNADGTYAGPPWGGADCSLAERSAPGSLALLFAAFALLGLRRRQ
jgi:thiol-disulfide isomerase/thioredoxin